MKAKDLLVEFIEELPDWTIALLYSGPFFRIWHVTSNVYVEIWHNATGPRKDNLTADQIIIYSQKSMDINSPDYSGHSETRTFSLLNPDAMEKIHNYLSQLAESQPA